MLTKFNIFQGLGESWDTWWLTGERDMGSYKDISSFSPTSLLDIHAEEQHNQVERSVSSMTDSSSCSLSESSTGYNSDLLEEIDNETSKLDTENEANVNVDTNETSSLLEEADYRSSLPCIARSNKDISQSNRSIIFKQLNSKSNSTRTNKYTTIGAIF